MIRTRQMLRSSRCTLCPAVCEISLLQAGPDIWRTEYPLIEGSGLCPRGSALGELLSCRSRILAPAERSAGALRRIDLTSAWEKILQAAGDGIIFLLDAANVPCQQMSQAAAWCRAWPKAQISFVIEPADEQLLLGTEAAGANYLTNDDLASCDGFLIIGDAFAANPICARAIFDRRKEQPRMPIVVIDPAAGTAAKFASHRLETPVGMELQSLMAVASQADVKVDSLGDLAAAKAAVPSAEAGAALAKCKRLAVLVAAEYGRSAAWRQIGYLAGKLAGALGGGVATQTVGANALAALRLAEKLGAISLASAISETSALPVAIGADVLGMLGRQEPKIRVAAAALPNRTTEAADLLLPAALPCELGGTYLQAGKDQIEISPLLPPPAGVPTPAEIVEALAKAAGIAKPASAPKVALKPLKAEAPAAAPAWSDPSRPLLLLGRQASQAGCGALTVHDSWQASEPYPELRISPADARQLNVISQREPELLTAAVNGKTLQVRPRVAPELSPGTVVLAEGLPECRSLIPSAPDEAGQAMVALPATVELSRLEAPSGPPTAWNK